jgi:hypothetical protein
MTTNYITVSSREETEDIYFFSTPKQLTKLNKFDDKQVKIKAGTCLENDTPGPISNRETLPNDYLHQALYNSQAYSFMLELDKCTEISSTERAMLNKDWLSGKEMRLTCAQLLGGAILVDGEQVLFLNTVEVYARSPVIDAHHE